MQGAFPENADWESALNPEVDDSVKRKMRSDLLERELARLARNRADGAPADPPRDPYVEGPYPPSAFFHLDGKKYYILKAPFEKERARQGVLGHYIVATVVTETRGNHRKFCRPFLNQKRIATADRVPLPNGSPGTAQGDVRNPPSKIYCVLGRDYIVPNNVNPYFEIGVQVLRDSLEVAESLDLAFARRMEGLNNVASEVCWDCLDPDYDPSDRPAVMEQFMSKYLARFYDEIDPNDGPSASDVSDEALHKHKAFCQAWARKHYRTLTPAITSPAEALVSEYYPYLESKFAPNARLTRAELARLFMRHPDISAEFASCLHHFSTNLEQTRGGRNASYKQMTYTSMARAASYKRMGDLLGQKMTVLVDLFHQLADTHNRHFHHMIVDWYAILGQMPQVHRFFFNSSSLTSSVKRARRDAAAAAHIPPWRTGRVLQGQD
jgi:hypothetical protein